MAWSSASLDCSHPGLILQRWPHPPCSVQPRGFGLSQTHKLWVSCLAQDSRFAPHQLRWPWHRCSSWGVTPGCHRLLQNQSLLLSLLGFRMPHLISSELHVEYQRLVSGQLAGCVFRALHVLPWQNRAGATFPVARCGVSRLAALRRPAGPGSIPLHGQDTTWSRHKQLLAPLGCPAPCSSTVFFPCISPTRGFALCLPPPASPRLHVLLRVTQQMTPAQPDPLRQGTGSVWGWRRVRGRGGGLRYSPESSRR